MLILTTKTKFILTLLIGILMGLYSVDYSEANEDDSTPYWCAVEIGISGLQFLNTPKYPLRSIHVVANTHVEDMLISITDTSLQTYPKDIMDLQINVFQGRKEIGTYFGQKPDGRFVVGSNFRNQGESLRIVCGLKPNSN